MAITAVDYEILKKLRADGAIPPRPAVLELGEAEWYGDIALPLLSQSIENFVEDEDEREKLHQRMVDVVAARSPTRSWDLARIFYGALLRFSRIVAIDFHGTPAALRIDLNHPVDLKEDFDVVINSGTAEHVFNVFQFFSTVHDVTRAGGLMMHAMPFQGWLEHGFYNFNPGFVWDLAKANDYAMVLLAYTEHQPARVVLLERREQIVEMERAGALGRNSLLYAVLRKGRDKAPFRIPMQSVYADGLSETMAEAWRSLR